MVDLKGLKFAKMHGIGNDFPIIDESREEQMPEADKPEACRQLCHRNFGVGGDGVLFVVPSEVADTGCLIQTDLKLKCVETVFVASVILFTETRLLKRIQ